MIQSTVSLSAGAGKVKRIVRELAVIKLMTCEKIVATLVRLNALKRTFETGGCFYPSWSINFPKGDVQFLTCYPGVKYSFYWNSSL